MIRRVEVQHRVVAAVFVAFEERLNLRIGLHEHVRVAFFHTQMGIAQQPVHVVVAEQDPRTDRALMHGVLVAHLRVLLVGIVEEPGFERVQHRGEVAGVLGRGGALARRHARDRTPVMAVRTP